MDETRPLRPPVEVMLARAVDAVPGAHALPGGVQYEQKWDGYRLVGFSTPRPHLQSRRGADLTDAFPEIAAAVASLGDVVVDGEQNSDAAWYYPEPKPAAAEIRDRIAFWKGVEVG